jgi:hypothetical protein
MKLARLIKPIALEDPKSAADKSPIVGHEEGPEPKWPYRGLIIVLSALVAWLFVIAAGAAVWFLLFPSILQIRHFIMGH